MHLVHIQFEDQCLPYLILTTLTTLTTGRIREYIWQITKSRQGLAVFARAAHPARPLRPEREGGIGPVSKEPTGAHECMMALNAMMA